MAYCTNFFWSGIISALPIYVQRFRFQHISHRTMINIFYRGISKVVFELYIPFRCPFNSCFPQIRHMGLYAAIITSQKIINGNVLAVSHNCVGRYARCHLMLFQQWCHQVSFVDISGGGLCCGYYLTPLINRPMHLIGKLRLSTVDYGCIRISAGNISTLLFIMCLGRFIAFAFFFQPGFKFLWFLCN